MPRKKDPLDRLYDLDIKRASALIFTTAFVFRAFLNLMFFERFGYRSVQYLETWYLLRCRKGKAPANVPGPPRAASKSRRSDF